MSIKEYAKNRFYNDIKEMDFTEGTCINEHGKEESCRYFGGLGWKDYPKNIEKVAEKDRADFVATLFTAVALEQTMYTYFKDEYSKVRNHLTDIHLGAHNNDNGNRLTAVGAIVGHAKNEGAFDKRDNFRATGDNSFVKEWAEFFLENVELVTKASGVSRDTFMKKLLADENFMERTPNGSDIFDRLVREVTTLSNVSRPA